MATILNAAALTSVKSGRAKGRPPAEYAAYVAAVADAGKPVGGCEADFAEVKPAHVLHMFRLILKADAALAARVTLGKSAEYGVCLIPVAPAAE